MPLSKYKKNLGLTLIELLVATVISITVLTILIQSYIKIKQHYNSSANAISTEVKELTAKRLIPQAINSAGLACKFGYLAQTYHDRTGDSLDKFVTDNSAINVGKLPFAKSSILPSGLESGCSGKCYQKDTDYIMIKKEDSHTTLTSTNNLEPYLKLKSINGLETGDYLALCNNQDINLVKISSIDKGSNIVNLTQSPTNSSYYPGDYVGKYTLEILYVRNTGEKDKNGNNIYSLYVYIKTGKTRGISYELIRGLSNLKIQYATKTNNNSTNNNSISWHSVNGNIKINNLSYKALKISFTVNDKPFEQVIIL